MKPSAAIGCGGALLGLLVLMPLWLYLVHYLLAATDAPAPVWAAFWVYVAASVVIRIVGGIAQLAEQKEGE